MLAEKSRPVTWSNPRASSKGGAPHGASQVERLLPWALLHELQTQVRASLGVVRDAEQLLPVVELTVLADHRVRFIDIEGHRDGLVGLDVAETRVLKEMTTKGVARITGRLVSGRDPRTSLDQIVLRVERRSGEVVVVRMDLEAVKSRDGRLGPLPDVAHDVVEIAEAELRDGTSRGVVFEIDVARAPAPSTAGPSRPGGPAADTTRPRWAGESALPVWALFQLQKALASR